MRISQLRKDNMQQKILEDLYGKTEEAFKIRQAKVTRQAREYFLAPHMQALNSLPAGLAHICNTCSVRIVYKQHDKINANKLVETWHHRLSNSEFNFDRWTPYPLDPKQYQEVAILAEEIIAFKKESVTMKQFLKATLNIHLSLKPLKKAWPESLHKYLPKPKVRVKRDSSSKRVVPPTINVPDALNTRLVTNLLEET